MTEEKFAESKLYKIHGKHFHPRISDTCVLAAV